MTSKMHLKILVITGLFALPLTLVGCKQPEEDEVNRMSSESHKSHTEPIMKLSLNPDEISAKWIWKPQADYKVYNQTILAKKEFTLQKPVAATIRITADSFYRLFINGQWVNDGPCRSWPEHYQYDQIDISGYIRHGSNHILIIARYYGVGDFHRVCKQAGLLAQLNIIGEDGKQQRIITDNSWDVAAAQGWIVNTPKVSIQMEPAEWFDARLTGQEDFTKAAILYEADRGPWSDLNPRDVALLTKEPFAFRSFIRAKLVKCDGWNFCLPSARLVNPGIVEANHTVSNACGMATILHARKDSVIDFQSQGFKVALDGQILKDGRYNVKAGSHLILAFVREVCGHDKEKSVRFFDPQEIRLANPMDENHKNPWCFLRFNEFAFVKDDLRWINFRHENKEVTDIINQYNRLTDDLMRSVTDLDAFPAQLSAHAEKLDFAEMFVNDSIWQFQNRREIGDATRFVTNPSGLMFDNGEVTTVFPGGDGDVELLYDLGEQNCGYYALDLIADPGVKVDINGVEYITEDGRIQFARGHRNGLRYITKQGRNRFISLKRRSGRYIFITLRDQHRPVRIRNVKLIESTYPLDYVGSFSCSDARLDAIWEISARTLKLCMEDSFTDCPLYEQTLWVGDARNESLFGYTVFGSTDIARRCIRLAGESLERYPIVGCQVPSAWDCLLPAWSFLWGISTWDYYWYTGDREFLRTIQPVVIRNLKGAESMLNKQDLFSGPYWNMFDWSGIDQGGKTVLHNSMFVIGAIDAALLSAEALDDDTNVAWLKAFRSRVANAVNALWDTNKHTYPDAVRDDGSISPSTCQHTSFLAVLYDVIAEENISQAQRNILNPPEGMVRVGSPFAMLYLYQALEKLGQEDQIIGMIYKNYLPMLEAGATTVWESFPTGTTGSGGFPTRSHSHAWSSAPVHFLNRIVLGIKPVAPGGSEIEISPRLNGLSWAKGASATINGPVQVRWQKIGDTLKVNYSAPEGTIVRFVHNDTHEGLKITVNNKPLP
ncbi:MAG: alpha-L-rhamnosidase N-terminal domain-containing protein [Sedimentisphaerales bacterium]|nr:alpha-L-rhamnosidase N-terminal domain-containing protein [Sedimentisphaerales bacterium]